MAMMPLSSQLIKLQRSLISKKKTLKSWENLLRNLFNEISP